jgi:hypothetical protein
MGLPVANQPFGNQDANVAFGGGRFVAVSSGGRTAHSTDGLNWTAATSPFDVNVFIATVTYGNGGFVAGTNSGDIAYSFAP